MGPLFSRHLSPVLSPAIASALTVTSFAISLGTRPKSQSRGFVYSRVFSQAARIAVCAAACWGAQASADECRNSTELLIGKRAPDIEYSPRHYSPGYRFVVDGVDYELTRTTFASGGGERLFAITHPVLAEPDLHPLLQDFFVTVETRQSAAASCSDIALNGESTVHPVKLREESQSAIRFGDLDKNSKMLESTRTLAAKLRVRVDGTEMTLATGFSTSRRLNISDCAKSLDDSYGYIEHTPGQITVACFPADPKSRNHVDEIEWEVDYKWPLDPPKLLDELIDYVYVEPI
ncbi:MAG: hypothetical protein AAGI88_13950 [Pseudomonadota bacterium]